MLEHNERLERLDLTTLQRRRIRGDLKETNKILNGKERMGSDQFFQLSANEHGLRGHNMKICMQRSKQNVRKFFYSCQVVNDRNACDSSLFYDWLMARYQLRITIIIIIISVLPQQVVDSKLTNSFKNALDKH